MKYVVNKTVFGRQQDHIVNTRFTRLATSLISAMLIGLGAHLAIAEEPQLYRYVNQDGVKVINHTIPPEFAQYGYDIISPKGQLIRKVEPAPTDGEIAQENKERMLREKFEVLKRRYASANDIESAKRRRLENLDTNIAILRGNVGSINNHIENLMNQAADAERAGRSVPANLLRQLRDARAELNVTENSLELRLQEYEAVAARFDKDLAVFIEGKKLISKNNYN